ncbi:hypothetical protein BN132_3615 [Cronobacter turicensis 564]|nr:hypothetical protein BN132_3615 [Cronobacter turicensis 564]
MGGDNHALTAFQARQNGFIPVRDNAIDGQRQALGQRQLLLAQFCVTRIVARETLVIFGQRRRGHREAATPLFHLIVTVFFSGFSFVQTLQGAVVTLVQFPGFFNRQPGLIQPVQDVPQRVDGTFQHGGISKIKAVAFVFKQLACGFRFADAFFRQVNVVPTGKAVFVVPLAFAVTNQNQLSNSHSITPS